MEQRVGFVTGETKKDKVAHYPAQRVTESMTDDQKRFVKGWNDMRKKLLEHGLMEEK